MNRLDRRERGFTLSEVLLVVALTIVLVGLTFLLGHHSVSHRDVDGAAYKIKGGLELARSTSVSTGGAKLQFYQSGSAITGWSVIDGSGRVVRHFNIPHTVTVSVNPSVTTIEFRSNGSLTAASVGGPSGTQTTITCATSDGSFSRVVQVHKVTGSVTMGSGT